MEGFVNTILFSRPALPLNITRRNRTSRISFLSISTLELYRVPRTLDQRHA
jgi:hypothetical protein